MKKNTIRTALVLLWHIDAAQTVRVGLQSVVLSPSDNALTVCLEKPGSKNLTVVSGEMLQNCRDKLFILNFTCYSATRTVSNGLRTKLHMAGFSTRVLLLPNKMHMLSEI